MVRIAKEEMNLIEVSNEHEMNKMKEKYDEVERNAHVVVESIAA